MNRRAGRGASYGVDAPRLLSIPAVLVIAGVVQGILTGVVWPFLGSALILVCLGLGVYASRRGKFAVWSELLDAAGLTGAERVLGLGCGRGAVLPWTATRLVCATKPAATGAQPAADGAAGTATDAVDVGRRPGPTRWRVNSRAGALLAFRDTSKPDFEHAYGVVTVWPPDTSRRRRRPAGTARRSPRRSACR